MSLVQFNRRLPILDRMFPEISDITDNMSTEDLFLKDSWMPAINVKEHKKGFKVSILDDVLSISAESKKENESEL